MMDDYWHVNGNYYHKFKYSKERAMELGSELINCKGCIDCIGCTDCSHCRDCTNCLDCVDCIDCNGCIDCVKSYGQTRLFYYRINYSKTGRYKQPAVQQMLRDSLKVIDYAYRQEQQLQVG